VACAASSTQYRALSATCPARNRGRSPQAGRHQDVFAVGRTDVRRSPRRGSRQSSGRDGREPGSALGQRIDGGRIDDPEPVGSSAITRRARGVLSRTTSRTEEFADPRWRSGPLRPDPGAPPARAVVDEGKWRAATVLVETSWSLANDFTGGSQ